MRVVCRLSIPQAAWMLPRVWSRRGAPQTGAPISRDADKKERSMGRRAPQEAAGTPAFLASLGSPDYRRLWSATACSQAAVWALVVLRGALLNAVALNQLVQQGARIFGPLCILPIIRFVKPEPAFFLAAGLYAMGWVQILRIRTASRGTMVATSGLLGNLVAGIRYIYTQPLLRALILVTVCHCALTMAYESAFPLVARTQLGLHAAKDLFAGPAYLMIGLGAGAVLGNLVLARGGD